MAVGYLTLKLIHIFGVVVFLGNIIVTGVWKGMADRTRRVEVVAFGQRLVTLTDFVFTGLGAAIVLLTGLMMTQTLGWGIWRTLWLQWGVGLFLASGLIWVGVLIPIQIKQARLARHFGHDPIDPEYWRLGRIWMFAGVVAILLPVGTLCLMVFKPT